VVVVVLVVADAGMTKMRLPFYLLNHHLVVSYWFFSIGHWFLFAILAVVVLI
jgi:hypothetical protein